MQMVVVAVVVVVVMEEDVSISRDEVIWWCKRIQIFNTILIWTWIMMIRQPLMEFLSADTIYQWRFFRLALETKIPKNLS